MAKCAAMGSAVSRVLGLDVGSKTIGTAVTDELGVCAHVGKTLERRGTRLDVAQVQQLAAKYQTDRVVVGMPFESDGSIGKRAERVQVFIDALVAAGLKVEPIDEGFSTVEATETLLAADLTRARRRQVVDSMAAQVILQRWLDTQRPKSSGSE